MKQEIKEIFSGIFSIKKVGPNFLGGIGVGYYSYIFVPPKNISINQNIFLDIIESEPLVFIIGFIVGYISTNMLVKETNKVSMRKLYFLMPIIVIWLLSVVLLTN
tara:strand:- start:98 stop:412 length:315 start_codon:yes stop_codon:yes gene_type:complete